MPESNLEIVDSIFIRQINPGTFFNIERKTDAGPSSGGGQGFIDLPMGGGTKHTELWNFLGAATPSNANDPGPTVKIRTKVLGSPHQSEELEFTPWYKKRGRYRISNQNRHKVNGQRHLAWRDSNGFPKADDNVSSPTDPLLGNVSSLKIFIVRTTQSTYYAGFVDIPTIPLSWPKGMGLESLFDPKVKSKMLQFSPSQIALSASEQRIIKRILEAWTRKKNVLLYGPPGTGKTHAMQKLWELLGAGAAGQGLALDPNDKDNPFQLQDLKPHFPLPVRREWVTFHQNFSYENFVLALRPDSSTGALQLVPRAGVLLDAAMSVDSNLTQSNPFGSAVIYIDEVNRGNVSRIFGEFITFMDEEYRAHNTGRALPVPLSALRHVGSGQTEPVERIADDQLALPIPWYFPQHVYLLASMNSVDRAVAPLDTALARRFERIEVGPDLDFLAEYFGITDTKRLLKSALSTPVGETDELDDFEIEAEVAETTDATTEAPDEDGAAPATELKALETAWLLLYRLNYELAATLGNDFEIGHTYLFKVRDGADEDERFRILASLWDGAIYPQLRERFANRPEELLGMLRIRASAPTKKGYLFTARAKPPGSTSSTTRPVVDIKPLSEAAMDNLEGVKSTLRYLASGA